MGPPMASSVHPMGVGPGGGHHRNANPFKLPDFQHPPRTEPRTEAWDAYAVRLGLLPAVRLGLPPAPFPRR